MSVVAYYSRRKEGVEGAVALLLASGRATRSQSSKRVPRNEIHLVDKQSDATEILQLNPKHPALLMIALQTDAEEVRVALGMSRENGERRPWSRVIKELEAPKASLNTLMPTQQGRRIKFISEILRGLIFEARERVAAYHICEPVLIDELGHAHLPVDVDRHLGCFLFMRGALVVTFDDGKAAMGVKLSRDAQELGLDGRDFEGLPDHWHREKWTVIYGSSKAPKPYDEAGIAAEELQTIVRDNLARFHTQLEEEE